MVVNADKFHVTTSDKRNSNERITVEIWKIKALSAVKSLALQIDHKLSFNLDIFSFQYL